MNDTPIRTSLNKGPSDPMSWEQMSPMRRAAWNRGILVVKLDELADDFERQWAMNIGNRVIGKRA